MYYVYILKDHERDFYIGYAEDVQKRLLEHQKNFAQARLVYYEAYLTREDARKREHMLKYYGSAWRALKRRIGI